MCVKDGVKHVKRTTKSNILFYNHRVSSISGVKHSRATLCLS